MESAFQFLPVNSNQTNVWSGQSLRYIKATINSDVNASFNHFISHFPKHISPTRILDVGCGGGQWLTSMVSYFSGSTGVGLEPSIEGIKLLKSQYVSCSSIDFVQGSAHQMPFSSNSFDLVVAWSVLHWIGRDEYLQALGELVRVSSSVLVIMDFDPLESYRTPYSHRPGFYTFKNDFEPLILGSGIMKLISASQFRMGLDGVESITADARRPFARNPVNWDCRKMVIFTKDYDCLPLLVSADLLET